MSFRHCRNLFACSLFAVLSACGGGGGDAPAGPTLQSPPATAAALAQSSSEASAAVQASLIGAAAIARQDSGPDSTFLPTGDPFSAKPGNAMLLARKPASGHEQAMAVANLSCTDLVPPPCSGSVSFDTNISDANGNVMPAGSYLAFGFSALQFTSEGESYTIDGGLRIDFLSTLDANTTTFANTRFQLTSTNLGGYVGSEPFGPESEVALIEFDAQGDAMLTVDGRSFSGLSGITVTDANNYSIGSAIVRSAHWNNTNGHVTTTFQNWNVSNGRPLAGSMVSISAAGGGLTIAVNASSASTVVYDVQIDVGGVLKQYVVTATYSLGGVPSYVAIEVVA